MIDPSRPRPSCSTSALRGLRLAADEVGHRLDAVRVALADDLDDVLLGVVDELVGAEVAHVVVVGGARAWR